MPPGSRRAEIPIERVEVSAYALDAGVFAGKGVS